MNVERDDPGFAVVGALEQFGGVEELGVVEGGGELEDGLVGDRNPCEPHRHDRTQGLPRARGHGSVVW